MSQAIQEPNVAVATSSKLSARHLSIEERKAVWEKAGLQPTLTMLSTLFAQLDLAVSSRSRPQVEKRWAGGVPRPLRTDLLKALRKKQTILTVSTMLQCLKEVVEFASEDGQANVLPLDFAHCVLSINEDIVATTTRVCADGAGIDSTVVMNSIAQHSLDYPYTFETLASEAAQNWLQPWPSTTGPKVVQSIGGEPRQIFEKAVGVKFLEFLTLGWTLYNMVSQEGKVQFGEGNFVVMNLGDEVIDAFKDRCVWQLPDLRERLRLERDGSSGTPWTRYYLQMRPFIQLASGSFLLVRPQYLVQRFMGEPLVVDVNEILKSTDKAESEHFRNAVNHKFETKIGATLKRISNHLSGDGVISEYEMIKAFRIKKGSNESICDFAYVSDKLCILIDANNRHLMQGFAEGTGTLEEFDSEIRLRFSTKKFMQLNRTIEQFQKFGWKSNGLIIDDQTTFVPLVVGPEDGIPSNKMTERLILESSRSVFEEFGNCVLPATIVSWRDLRILEGLVEKRGVHFAKLLLDWRNYCVSHPEFQCSVELYEQHRGYDGPLPEHEHKLGFDFFEDMRTAATDIYIERLPPDLQANARRMVEQAKRTLPTKHL
ncbi:hypothetical protein ACFVKB_45165 [Rhodococcus sp. NPDC127530]|uniref:hypothetical protein n=1 Tax=unclassified Rhodococcus (in: high G+C Gram-positive bacteria) TaxID=192944 RepID=UPI003637A0C3